MRGSGEDDRLELLLEDSEGGVTSTISRDAACTNSSDTSGEMIFVAST